MRPRRRVRARQARSSLAARMRELLALRIAVAEAELKKLARRA